MKVYGFSTDHMELVTGYPFSKIQETLMVLAADSDTSDLVVAFYVLPGTRFHRGTAYARQWRTPAQFQSTRGFWRFTGQWPIPEDLPSKYLLIRMRLDGRPNIYPHTETDTYGWVFRYPSFIDHLALLFAHELHHFRRYHLNLHPKEGEHAANKWALNTVRQNGYPVNGNKKYSRSKRRKKRILPMFDPYTGFRNLKAGDRIVIIHDPRGLYIGQTASLVRPLRADARRIVILTSDGKKWRWPMDWAKPGQE